MSFQTISFLVFLAATVLLCRLAGNSRTGWGFLLAACVVFYIWGGTKTAVFSLLLLAAGMAISYGAARYLLQGGKERRRVLVGALVWHTGVLMIFKYLGFFSGGAVALQWVPLGLSFFTFQQIWFLKEVYTGAVTQLPSVGAFSVYGLFFPSVVSGPILRPGAFFPQTEEAKFLHPDTGDVAAGLYAICCGTVKKVLLADSFGIVVNNGWGHLGQLSAPAAWLIILGYTLQLYFDFSGYCDIAAGAARLLGIRLPVNFNSPYRAASVGEFWKKWHITLTTFLRECIYIPLGGSRKGRLRTYGNIMLVFLISGFWHGAGWPFLFWGALHGAAQVLERLLGSRREKLPYIMRWGLTFLFINVAWVFFRAPSLGEAGSVLRAALFGGLEKPASWLVSGLFSREVGALQILFPTFANWSNILRIGGLYLVGIVAALWPHNVIQKMDTFRPDVLRTMGLVLLTAWSVLSFSGVVTFIYSNF